MFSPRPVGPAAGPAVNLPPRYTPTRHNVRQFAQNYNVPVVHPSHTTNVVTHNWRYFHSYPHTESTVHCTTCQDIHCGPGRRF
ncbi:spore coat protein [Evansella sp. LMS18]|uniref:CotD family spore coat protein n=1 Tax=Evansella sp. LMS18 TaxID=2924033 RepID=UPI0020D1811B|nr:CotD family spore coat protein [Evansella sp. LMS18]UTR10687.1 spore coat protein [Evansella sp. LMS18]